MHAMLGVVQPGPAGFPASRLAPPGIVPLRSWKVPVGPSAPTVAILTMISAPWVTDW